MLILFDKVSRKIRHATLNQTNPATVRVWGDSKDISLSAVKKRFRLVDCCLKDMNFMNERKIEIPWDTSQE